ncbi:MAG: S46 family peptidase [Planctomycetota bacterium]
MLRAQNRHLQTTIDAYLKMSPDQLRQLDDPFMKSVVKLHPEYIRMRELNKQRDGELNQLYGDLITIKQEFQKANFVPDANATLRLTHGTVRGYSPEDAVYMRPATTLSGVIAKTTGTSPFETPQEVIDMHAAKNFGKYAHPKLNDVPVAILYDTDTTGGNSGSPILDGNGRLVGVNFDRAFEATINDFAWNTNYSRSIGVDIRYVLWITDSVYGAKFLISEMGL